MKRDSSTGRKWQDVWRCPHKNEQKSAKKLRHENKHKENEDSDKILKKYFLCFITCYKYD